MSPGKSLKGSFLARETKEIQASGTVIQGEPQGGNRHGARHSKGRQCGSEQQQIHMIE
jgi:hypothetical protein